MTKRATAPDPFKMADNLAAKIDDDAAAQDLDQILKAPLSCKERREYARLKEANSELLAALKDARDALDGAPNTVGLHRFINTAIARAEGSK